MNLETSHVTQKVTGQVVMTKDAVCWDSFCIYVAHPYPEDKRLGTL